MAMLNNQRIYSIIFPWLPVFPWVPRRPLRWPSSTCWAPAESPDGAGACESPWSCPSRRWRPRGRPGSPCKTGDFRMEIAGLSSYIWINSGYMIYIYIINYIYISLVDFTIKQYQTWWIRWETSHSCAQSVIKTWTDKHRRRQHCHTRESKVDSHILNPHFSPEARKFPKNMGP